jgi:hypothetical protein
MKNISAALTKDQIRTSFERLRFGFPPKKYVTRRLGWKDAKVGDRLQFVEKGQGLKRGEKAVKICVVELTSVRRERLHDMTLRPVYGLEEVKREGFPDLTPSQFVGMFCEHNNCKPSQEVTRMEFKYIV